MLAHRILRQEGISVQDFAYNDADDNYVSPDDVSETESQQSALAAYFALVEEAWCSPSSQIEREPDSPDSEEFGEITIVRDDGEITKTTCSTRPGAWIQLDDSPQKDRAKCNTFMLIEPVGMDVSVLDTLWQKPNSPMILPGRLLAPIQYNGRRCMFKDLRDDAAAVAEYVGFQNVCCPDRKAYNDTQTDGILALQRHVNDVGKMAAQLAFTEGRQPHCRGHNYLEVASPLTLMRFKSGMLAAFAETTREYSNARIKLKVQKMEAELEKDTVKAARISRRRRMLNQQMFDEAYQRVTSNLRGPLLAEQDRQVECLADLYALFEVQRTILLQEDFDVLQAVDSVLDVQDKVAGLIDSHSHIIEEGIDHIQDFMGTSDSLMKKACTRMRRITAADVGDPIECVAVAKARLGQDEGMRMVCKTIRELDGVKNLVHASTARIAEIEESLGGFVNPVLDVYVQLQDCVLAKGTAIISGPSLGYSRTCSPLSSRSLESHELRPLSTIDEEGEYSKGKT